MIGPILGILVGSPLVVLPFWDNFWNLSDRVLVPTHSVLSGGLSTSEVVFVSSAAAQRRLGTPQRRQQPAIHSYPVILYLQYVNYWFSQDMKQCGLFNVFFTQGVPEWCCELPHRTRRRPVREIGAPRARLDRFPRRDRR